ncbi:MAG: hypothetical protein JWM87_1166 [Candidatus Eremiobacteraeota bacterium]|nr:hypothetical protein [Candidatus Eremiobacteraeota bacterium]
MSPYGLALKRQNPVLGTTVTREGVAFVSPLRLVETELQFTFILRERAIPSHVHVDHSETMQAENKPEPKKADFTPKTDDEFRSLPATIQNAVVDQLVRAGRLNAPAPGTVPLIRMIAGRVHELGQGRTAQDLLIHSRVKMDDGGTRAYDTRFRMFSSQRIQLIA